MQNQESREHGNTGTWETCAPREIPRRPLGETGLQVSVLGYGGAPIGFSEERKDEGFIALLHRAIEAGINFFDTAANYRMGEVLMGQALEGKRAEVIIATKCGRLQRAADEGWDEWEDWSEGGVLTSIEASLRNLRTDYIDLAQLHSPPRWALERGEALLGLQKAQHAGKVVHIGLSADGPDALYAVEMGQFATLQVSYSILEQEPGEEIIPAAAARGMGVIAKQPVANGIADMTEKPGHPDWAAKWERAQHMPWAQLGSQRGRTGLALRWLMANPQISTAIVGTTNAQHLQANIAQAAAGGLDEQKVTLMRDAYRVARRELEEIG